jgi:alpha-ribazole phosphatase
MSMITRWWWIRHGPVHNPDHRLYGQQDIDAHFPDEAALQTLTQRLPKDPIWLTSTLKRTHQTTQALGRDPDPQNAHADLNEQYFGDWQGMSHTELKAIGPAFDTLWRAPGSTRPPGGESFADVVRRVANLVERITEENTGRDIVAVAHGGTIRAALAVALNLEAEAALGFTIDTLSLTRIDHIPPGNGRVIGADRRWKVETVNLSP